MKKIRLLCVATLLVAMMLSACGQKAATDNTAADPGESQTDTTEDTAGDETTGEVKDIDFYGKIVEYTAGPAACDKTQELLEGKYNIESLQVDWANLDTVIRTGISSGEPCDIYQYWPQNLRALVDSGMVLDLTSYIEADAEFQEMVPESALNAGKYDGKYYGIPFISNYSVMIANKDILDANGIDVPTEWSWAEFNDVCQQLKDAGLFPVGQNTDNQQGNWYFRNGMLSLAASDGTLEDLASGQIACTDELFTTVFENVKSLYDNGYMYPGDGAVTITLDEVKAAFMQGKIAFMGETSANANTTIQSAADSGINAVVIPWPAMGDVNAVLGGFDGLFIPSNAKDPEAAFEVIKTYLSEDVQKLYADSGMSIVNPNVEITDESVKKLVEMSASVQTTEFMTLDAKINDYLTNEALAELVLGGGVEATQQALESLRQAAVQ